VAQTLNAQLDQWTHLLTQVVLTSLNRIICNGRWSTAVIVTANHATLINKE